MELLHTSFAYMDHGKNICHFLRTTEKRELNICTAHKLASPKLFTWEHILFLLCKQPSYTTKEDFRRSVQHTKKLSIGVSEVRGNSVTGGTHRKENPVTLGEISSIGDV